MGTLSPSILSKLLNTKIRRLRPALCRPQRFKSGFQLLNSSGEEHRAGQSFLNGDFATKSDLWQYESMGLLSRAFRLTAIFLVLFTAVEVLACDLLPNSDCYISQTQSQHKHQGPTSGDNCMCCCAHLVVSKRVTLVPPVLIVPAVREENAEQPLLAPSSIDHPPQLS
jgi:hypothetical protein